jgi:phosphoenolpyruvate-protein phosphotransferase
VDPTALSLEVAHFQAACQEAGEELDAIIAQVSGQLGDDAAAIFRGHRLLLCDPALRGKVTATILSQRIDARSALQEALDEYTALFAKIPDDYLRERLADIRDVVGRVMGQLALREAPAIPSRGTEPIILVAPEVLPSQALHLQRLNVVGIITEAGGSTGHAAILARSLGIPSVAGARGLLQQVATGDPLIVEGRTGTVHVRPDAETEAAYRKLQHEYAGLREHLVLNRDEPAVTQDGACLDLLANVNSVADAVAAAEAGATGVGLYRTEYLFLTQPTLPDEEEQFQTYRAVIEAAPNRRLTIRTLDLGGDKLVSYLGQEREANPFMGWRSIRIAATYPEFFQTQLRAILRAARFGAVNLLFPMVSGLEEVRQLKRMVRRTAARLRRDGVSCCPDLPVGVMIEVPAAALCIEAILKEVDFVSIGSNDLIQYVMAADRDNPRVAHLCEPFNPPVLRLLRHVLRACERAGRPVTLCGEMAGRPRCFLPLLGMGLRQFSMSPAFVPTIKELARRSTLTLAQDVARRALRLRTAVAVRRHVTRATRRIYPGAVVLGMQT